MLGEELEPGALRHLRAGDLQEERQALRDVQAPGEALLQARLEPVEELGLSDGHDFRRRLLQPRGEIADLVDDEPLEVGVGARLGRDLAHEELVVHVDVDVEALGHDRLDRLLGERDGNRLVAQPAPGLGLGHDGSLVADDGIVDARLQNVWTHGDEHAPRGDDDADPLAARRADRRFGARREHPVLRDQRAVEVAGEHLDVSRKTGREAQL